MALTFENIEKLKPGITSEEEFEESDYNDIPDLLGVKSYKDCLFALSDEDEEVSEHYYFLEGNGEHVQREGDLLLVIMDEIRFVILQRFDMYVIAIHKSNKEIAENLF